jgi:hypothetical protein
MAKTEDNIRASENFIREVLEKNFNQTIDSDELRVAAEKLCAAIPERQTEAA